MLAELFFAPLAGLGYDRAMSETSTPKRDDPLPGIIRALEEQHGRRIDDFLIPPPIFEAMQGEFVEYDAPAGVLTTHFPVLPEHLNPYRTLQGGMLAAAVDNTLGPLSMLVAPPNVTRRLELTYSRPVPADLPYIVVHAQFLGREGQQLTFKATVRDPAGVLLARARAQHWITG